MEVDPMTKRNITLYNKLMTLLQSITLYTFLGSVDLNTMYNYVIAFRG